MVLRCTRRFKKTFRASQFDVVELTEVGDSCGIDHRRPSFVATAAEHVVEAADFARVGDIFQSKGARTRNMIQVLGVRQQPSAFCPLIHAASTRELGEHELRR